jgi:hypothetical protein
MFGVTAGPASATDVYDGATAGVTTKAAVAETQEHVTVYARGDAALGGNVRGVAGQLALQVEAGAAAFDGPHHLFARGGFTGTLERDPYTGFFAIEAPVATVGHQFHGQGTQTFADGTHLDVGLRGGLLAAGRVFSATRQIDLVGDPELGPSSSWATASTCASNTRRCSQGSSFISGGPLPASRPSSCSASTHARS